MYSDLIWRESIAVRQADLQRSAASRPVPPRRGTRTSVATILRWSADRLDSRTLRHDCLHVS